MIAENQTRSPCRGSLAAVALLALLGACGGSDDNETVTAAQAQAAQGTPVNPAAANPAPAAGQPAGSPVVEERLSTVDCRTPADGRVHFGVGNAIFAVPGDEVRTVIPPNVTPSTQAAQIIEQLRTQTAQGAGCPESPLPAGLLSVSAPAGDPLLAPEIGFFLPPPGGIATPFGNLTREMLGNPNRCKPANGGLIACPAVETEGAQQMQSIYFLSTDTSRRLQFGGPLAARCIVGGDRIRGCEIVDELPGGVGLRAPLTSIPQSVDALAAAHRAALSRAGALRI